MSKHSPRQPCVCVASHAPAPLDEEEHHIWPLGMGGPDVPENRVWLCPTTHTNAHDILALMVKAKQPLAWRAILDVYSVPVNRYAYRVALLGYRRWMNHGLEGALL